uniref:BHLH domain-containing protein n=1 Tax=Macrostomum lignano TaxID=282301 RepID=A0A1I8IYY4_9PLAT
MRRDKMNGYIQEMASLVPLCRSASRKLDKLTVMRMTAQHLKTLRLRRLGNGGSGGPRPRRARILYASKGSDWPSKDSKCPEFEPRDLIGHNLFDIVHPKDVNLVKEQLVQPDSLQDLEGEQLDLSGVSFGLRRHFYCRIRTDVWAQLKAEGR